jgi:hypothetical protein
LGGPPLFLGYLLLHTFVVVGLVTPQYPDSETYMHLSVTGHDLRLPTVPLLYKILPTDGLRVAGQTLLAAVAWWILADSAARMIGERRVRIGLRVVLLALGLSTPITNWNTTILSEATAISLTVLLMGVWLRYVHDKRWETAGTALAVTLIWTFTRQPNVLFGLMITVCALAAVAVSRDARRVRVALAVALALITLAGFVEVHNNQTLSKNVLLYMIKGRIRLHPDWAAWFARHGMPDPRFDPAQPARAIPLNPAFRHWLDTRGVRTYITFAATHPGYSILAPLPYLSGEESSLYGPRSEPYSLGPNPKPSILSPSVNYGRRRNVLPSPVDEFLFDQGRIGSLLLLAVVAGVLVWTEWKRRRWDRRLTLPLLITLSAVPQAYIVWLSGGEATHELDRLSMVTAVSVRVGLWVILALALERFVLARRSSRPMTAE